MGWSESEQKFFDERVEFWRSSGDGAEFARARAGIDTRNLIRGKDQATKANAPLVELQRRVAAVEKQMRPKPKATTLPDFLQKKVAEEPDSILAEQCRTQDASYLLGQLRRYEFLIANEPIVKAVHELAERIAALEARPTVKHCGTHVHGQHYKEASLVTFQGGLWVARADTAAPPGSSSDWQLIVKSGKAT